MNARKCEPNEADSAAYGALKQSVDLYVLVSGQLAIKLRKTLTPLPGWMTDDNETGELSSSACKILVKALWLGRLARPDIIKPVGDLVTCVPVKFASDS